MSNRRPWSQERIEKLVSLYRQGVTLDKMAEELDTPITTIKSRISSVREEYNLPYRDPKQVKRKPRSRTTETRFDKDFSGPIPCGHWLITKPWSRKNDTKVKKHS